MVSDDAASITGHEMRHVTGDILMVVGRHVRLLSLGDTLPMVLPGLSQKVGQRLALEVPMKRREFRIHA